MKYLITESQLDRIVFRYLDNQDFIKIKKGNTLYLVNSERDEQAQIRYDKNDGWCATNETLFNEISSLFSLEYSDSKDVISRWVENTLQMKVTSNRVSPTITVL